MDTGANVSQPPLAQHDSKLLDLAFAMDTTGSMGSYINSARDNIRHIVEDIVAKESSDVRLALVEYRDHPPQDKTYVTRKHDFTPKVGQMKTWLSESKADGGGDAPEAVADALYDVLNLSWRKDATKICVLISDAPPHGLSSSGDSFPNGCPAGHDPMNIARQMAENAITLYVAGCEPALTRYKDFFAALAYITGGQYVPLAAAGALTAVIVGGAQEELSLEQFMDQVNQRVLQEVQQRGQDNVNMEDLSREVMGHLNMGGMRSKQLKVNSRSAAPASDYVKGMSACVDMESVRKNWTPAAAPAAPGGFTFSAMSSRGMLTKSKKAARPQRGAEDICDSIAMSSPPPPEAMCSLFGAPMGSAAPPPTYSTEEGEIEMHQAERMVQKALMRNNIHLSKK